MPFEAEAAEALDALIPLVMEAPDPLAIEAVPLVEPVPFCPPLAPFCTAAAAVANSPNPVYVCR